MFSTGPHVPENLPRAKCTEDPRSLQLARDSCSDCSWRGTVSGRRSQCGPRALRAQLAARRPRTLGIAPVVQSCDVELPES